MKLAIGTAVTPSSEKSRLNVIAIMAPSDAPAETPSVSGDASGLRSSAWNTTPASARLLPTSAAASTRGRRATQKIWASMLSAYGSDRSKTVDRWIGVLPTSGAEQAREKRDRAKARERPCQPDANRRRADDRRRPRWSCSTERHDRQMTGARMKLHIRFDVIEHA